MCTSMMIDKLGGKPGVVELCGCSNYATFNDDASTVPCDGVNCLSKCCRARCEGARDDVCNFHGYLQGYLDDDCTCKCDTNYQGDFCQLGDCDSTDCSGHGTASGRKQDGCTCSCDPGHVPAYPNA